MHLPEKSPRPSIYYKYQVFDPWLASQHGPQLRHGVTIVGAGPAGLVTALELARFGVQSVVLNSELQVSQGSRAIVFTRRSMEILQQVGVADRVLENGLSWRFGNSYYRGQRVFRMEATHDEDDKYPPMTNIQQQYLEEYLLHACNANPHIEVRWGNKVIGVEQHAQYATVQVDTPEGPYTLETQWLIAADGGRSDIRSAMGLKLEGASYEGFFVIADIKIDLPYPTERLAFFDPEWNRGNTILMHREPHGIWRIDYQLPPGETPEQALQPASLKERINAQLAMIGHAGVPWEMDWSSVYSARTLTLPAYQHGRTLFVGDAAHLLPIFGVRGANTAFQDAQSLGWHLGMVCKGINTDKFLQNFSTERVTAAREIITESGKSTRFMAPPSRGFRLLRDAVLSLSLTQSFVRPLYHWRTSRPHEYTHSVLNSREDDNALFEIGPSHGAPPQNVRLNDGNFLLDHLGGGFDLLYFVDDASHSSKNIHASGTVPLTSISYELQSVISTFKSKGLPIQVIAIGTTQPVEGADLHLEDRLGRVKSRYGVTKSGGAYLLRPDQHICARWQELDANRLHSTLQAVLDQ